MYKNVLIVGATGYLIGTKVTNAFLQKKDEFNTAILVSQRAMQDEKKMKILEDFKKRGAELIEGELDDPIELEKALQGIDAIICLITGNSEKLVLDGQIALIEAAKKAHVKRYFTSDYGMELSRIKYGEFSYYDSKKRIQDILEADSTIEHTFIATGVFAEFFFSPNYRINLKERKLFAFGPSTMKISVTHSDDIGKLVPEILLAPESKNTRIDLASCTTTFDEVLSVVEKITGNKFELIRESEEESFRDLHSSDFSLQAQSVVKMIYSRGDGYFEEPFNQIHPLLSKIKTLNIEEIIQKSLHSI